MVAPLPAYPTYPTYPVVNGGYYTGFVDVIVGVSAPVAGGGGYWFPLCCGYPGPNYAGADDDIEVVRSSS